MTKLVKKFIEKKPRYACPFYGFHFTNHNGRIIIIDSNGNGCEFCGMERRTYSPCRMEMQGKTPHWETCPDASEKFKALVMSKFTEARVIPNEFVPKEQTFVITWEGILLKDWMDYVLDPSTPRPAMKKSETMATIANNQ